MRHNDDNQLQAMMKRPKVSRNLPPNARDATYAMKQDPNERGPSGHRAARQRAPAHAFPDTPLSPWQLDLSNKSWTRTKESHAGPQRLLGLPTTPRLLATSGRRKTPVLSPRPRCLTRAPPPPPRLGHPPNWPGHRMNRSAKHPVALQSSACAGRDTTRFPHRRISCIPWEE